MRKQSATAAVVVANAALTTAAVAVCFRMRSLV